MSAYNYTRCPRCIKTRAAEMDKAEANLRQQYGIVTPEAYMLASDALAKLKQKEFPQNLREDYELGVNPDGSFSVSYGCSCSVCGFEFSYKHEEQVPDEPVQEGRPSRRRRN